MNAGPVNPQAVDPIVAQSEAAIREGSKSFAGAAKLLAPDVRESVVQLYAWCRYCDDVIDGQTLGHDADADEAGSESRLVTLREQTQLAIDGGKVDGVFAALQRVVQRHGIPGQHPHELLDGFAMDVSGRAYESREDVLEYCYHVAGVVGVMMAQIMGAKGDDALHRACDLGLAFQLTNICRDVVDDAELGRVYLPLDRLAAAGVPVSGVRAEQLAAAVADPAHRAAVYRVAQELLTEADRYYASAREGLRALPPRSAWSIAAARRIYADIGAVVRSRGERAWDERAVVTKGRKVSGALLAGLDALRARTVDQLVKPVPRGDLWRRPT